MKIDKRKFLGTILGTTMFVIMLLSFTYAYYTWTSSNTTLSFSIDDSYFSCESGIESNISGLLPVSDYRESGYQTFTVNNIGMSDTTFSLTMNITAIDEELLSESFKYKLVVDETGGSNNCGDINNTNCVEVGGGSFANAIVGMNTLVETIQIPNNVRYQYYLFLYIDGNMENDTAMQNASMTSILEVCEIVVFLDYQGGNKDNNPDFLKVTGIYEGLPTTATKANTEISFETYGGKIDLGGELIEANGAKIIYSFDGWYTEKKGSGNLITNGMDLTSTVNHTLYANWIDSGAITLPTLVKDGNTFDGWYSDSTYTTKVGDAGDSYNSDEDITLYAKWLTNAYVVTFDPNGGILLEENTKNVEFDSTYGTLPTPTRTGYTFKGWYTSTSGGSQITSDTKVTITENQTLYARWVPNTYNISYEYNGGTAGTDAPTTATYDTEVTISNPTKWLAIVLNANGTGASVGSQTSSQQTFAGWSSNNIDTTTAYYGDKAWNSTSQIANASTFKNLTPTDDGNVTLTARWTPVDVTIPQVNCPIGYSCTLNTTTDGNGTTYEPGGTYTPNETDPAVVNLYVIATPNAYNIAYTLNGGKSGTMAPDKATYDIPATISNPTKTVTITGYANSTACTVGEKISQDQTFNGWTSTTIDTSTAYYGSTAWTNTSTLVKATSFKNLTPVANAEVTLVANWSTPSSMKVPTLTPPTGYTCNWNTSETGNGTTYTSGATYTPSTNGDADIKLYAQIAPNTYTVNFYNGTTKIGEQHFVYDVGQYLYTWNELGGIIAEEYINVGWDFVGWSVDESYEISYEDGAWVSNLTATNNGIVSLYAVYEREITFYYQDRLGNPITLAENQLWNPTPYEIIEGSSLSSVASPQMSEYSGWNVLGYSSEIQYSGQMGLGYYEYSSGTSIYPKPEDSNELYGIYTREITFYSGVDKSAEESTEQRLNSYTKTATSFSLPTGPTTITNWDLLGYRADETASDKEYSLGETPYPNSTSWQTQATEFYAVYSRDLTIVYNGNGAESGTVEDTQTTIYLNTASTTTSDQTVTLANNGFTRTGYTFNGWTVGNSGGTVYAAGDNFNPNLAYDFNPFEIEVYANWETDTCTVVYYNGAAKLGESQHVIGDGSNLTTWSTWESLGAIVTYGNFGWNFSGWIADVEGKNYARYPTSDDNGYGDGASVSEIASELEISAGDTITLYAYYERTTNFFDGIVTTTSTPSSTITQYWNPVAYTPGVSYNSITTPSSIAGVSGWTALGFRNDTIAGGKQYTTSEEVFLPPNAYPDFYGVYVRTVHFYSGVDRTTDSQTTQYLNSYNDGYTSAITIPELTSIDNWTSLGYRADTMADEPQLYVNEKKQVTYNTSSEYYAVYGRTLTVSYKADDDSTTSDIGIGDTKKAIYLNTATPTTSNQEIKLPENVFSKNGYEFAGWILKGTSTPVYGEFDLYNPGLAYNDSFEITMNPTWKCKTYTITLDNQDADYAGTDLIYFVYTDALFLNADGYEVDSASLMTKTKNNISVPTKQNHSFEGYYTEPNGGGIKVLDKTGYVTDNVSDFVSATTSNITLYANWLPNSYKITLVTSVEQSDKYTSEICEVYGVGIYLNCVIVDSNLMTPTSNPITIPIDYPNGLEDTFNGYYTEEGEEGIQLIDENGYITSVFTNTYFTETANLYDSWIDPNSKIPKNIVYYNGSTVLGTSSCMSGEDITLSSWKTLGGTVTYSAYGWGFDGWANANNTYEETYTDGESIICPDSDMGIYAVYARTITFKSGVSALTSSTATQYWNSYGSTQGTHLSAVTSPSLTAISNWTANGYIDDTSASSLSEYPANNLVYPPPSASSTLYGVYKRTLTFYSGVNKATIDGTRTQYLNSFNNTVSAVTAYTPATIANWTSLGYRTNTTAGTYTYSCTKAGTSCKPIYSSSNSLYAVYSRTLTISYNGNGNTGGSMSGTTRTVYLNTNSTTTSTQTVTLAANGFTKTGYTFSKWATGSPDGTQYEASTSYTPSLAYNAEKFGVTMYAIWRINNVVFNFNANGGYLENTSSTLPDGSTREWVLDDDGTVMACASIYEEVYGSYCGKNFWYFDYGTSGNILNYNDSSFFILANYGLGVQTGAEWICLSGCIVENATFSQTQTYSHSDFCDASAGDCTVVLGVNWNKLVSATTTGSFLSSTWTEPGYILYDTPSIVYYPETGDSITYENNTTDFGTIYSEKYIGKNITSGSTVYVEKTNDNELTGIRTSANYSNLKWQKIWVRNADISASLSSYKLDSRIINGETYYAIYYNYTGTANKLTNIGDVE